MTNNEKLEKIKKLADDMYYAAANLGPNVGSGERLRKTMEEYHKFIIHEYNKEDPNFKVGDTIQNVDFGDVRTVVEVREDCYKLDNCSILHFNAQDNWELVEEYNITGIKSRHATGKLKECIDNQTKEGLDKARKQLEEESKKCMYTQDFYTDKDRRVLCEGCEEECRFSRKGLNTSERELIATREALAYVNNINRGESPWTDSDMEEAYEEGYKSGAKWQMEKDNNNANHALVEQIKTQKMYYEKGMTDMKQQMMANAVDVTVHIDNGNYPYIPPIELYDYDKDIPLAREGDKYKVILIKED